MYLSNEIALTDDTSFSSLRIFHDLAHSLRDVVGKSEERPANLPWQNYGGR